MELTGDPTVEFKKRTESAVMPARATAGSAGYDLTADESVSLNKNSGVVRVNTGISITKMPYGCYARVAMRSGLAVRNHFVIDAGVVDSDYRGPLIVCFHTVGPDDYTVNKGERIAQLIFERILCPPVRVSDGSDEKPLDTSAHAGFGSTGI